MLDVHVCSTAVSGDLRPTGECPSSADMCDCVRRRAIREGTFFRRRKIILLLPSFVLSLLEIVSA
jgi:hypothetical protein